jgi:hypothetical protein
VPTTLDSIAVTSKYPPWITHGKEISAPEYRVEFAACPGARSVGSRGRLVERLTTGYSHHQPDAGRKLDVVFVCPCDLCRSRVRRTDLPAVRDTPTSLGDLIQGLQLVNRDKYAATTADRKTYRAKVDDVFIQEANVPAIGDFEATASRVVSLDLWEDSGGTSRKE